MARRSYFAAVLLGALLGTSSAEGAGFWETCRGVLAQIQDYRLRKSLSAGDYFEHRMQKFSRDIAQMDVRSRARGMVDLANLASKMQMPMEVYILNERNWALKARVLSADHVRLLSGMASAPAPEGITVMDMGTLADILPRTLTSEQMVDLVSYEKVRRLARSLENKLSATMNVSNHFRGTYYEGSKKAFDPNVARVEHDYFKAEQLANKLREILTSAEFKLAREAAMHEGENNIRAREIWADFLKHVQKAVQEVKGVEPYRGQVQALLIALHFDEPELDPRQL